MVTSRPSFRGLLTGRTPVFEAEPGADGAHRPPSASRGRRAARSPHGEGRGVDQRDRAAALPEGRQLRVPFRADRVLPSLPAFQGRHDETRDHEGRLDDRPRLRRGREERPRVVRRHGEGPQGAARLSREAGRKRLHPRLAGPGRPRLQALAGWCAPDGHVLGPRHAPEDGRVESGRGLPRGADDTAPTFADLAFGTTELGSFRTADGTLLYTRLVKPLDFDPKKKYPAVVFVYGGPHAQVVQDRWGGTSLFDHLMAQSGILVWSVDNRGSWARGHAFETPLLKKMGATELRDQLAGVEELKKLPFVDAGRIGLWGWSYGGYMTLYLATHAGRELSSARRPERRSSTGSSTTPSTPSAT